MNLYQESDRGILDHLPPGFVMLSNHILHKVFFKAQRRYILVIVTVIATTLRWFNVLLIQLLRIKNYKNSF